MIIDIHSDTWSDVLIKQENGENDILNKYHYEKLLKGGVNGSIFVIWPDPPYDSEPLKRTKKLIKAIDKEMKHARNHFEIVHNNKEFNDAVKKNKIAVYIGLEGLSSIGKDIYMIEEFYRIGARHASLTWNEENELATGASGTKSRGLTKLGEKAYKKIRDLNMIFDVSHLNEESFWDIIRIADKPFIASHSNCKAICDVKRNLSNEQLKEINRFGGLVGINAFNQFVHKDREKQTVEMLAEHLYHMVDIMSIDNVVLGFDFCDYINSQSLDTFSSQENSFTKGIEDSSKIPNIVESLKKLGFNKKDIDKITYQNFMKFTEKILV